MTLSNAEQSLSPNLPEALRRARMGSREDLGHALEGCRQYLLLVANRELEPLLRGKVGASDLVQETFLAADRGFHRFRGSTKAELLAWLRQILISRLFTERRYFDAMKRQVGREVPLCGELSAAFDQRRPSHTSAPICHVMDSEETRHLLVAVDHLPPRHRQVIFLRHVDQLAFAEIAERLDLSLPAARQLWARAITNLRRKMQIVNR